MKTGFASGESPPVRTPSATHAGVLRVLRAFVCLALAWPLALWLAGCNHRQKVSLIDSQGAVFRPLEASRSAKANAVVLLFVSTDCPISNRYAPEFSRLDAVYSPQGIRFWLVYPGPGISPTAVEQHRRAFGLSCPAGRDPDLRAVKAAGIQVTPEAAVYLPGGQLVYCGRIDDRFVDYGLKRPEPTRRDLEHVLQDVLQNKHLTLQRRPAVGCPLVK